VRVDRGLAHAPHDAEPVEADHGQSHKALAVEATRRPRFPGCNAETLAVEISFSAGASRRPSSS
jgi:hypothetical protein